MQKSHSCCQKCAHQLSLPDHISRVQKKEKDDSGGWRCKGNHSSNMKSLLPVGKVGKVIWYPCLKLFVLKVAFLQPTEPVDDDRLLSEAEEGEDGLEITSNEEVDARNPRYLSMHAVITVFIIQLLGQLFRPLYQHPL